MPRFHRYSFPALTCDMGLVSNGRMGGNLEDYKQLFLVISSWKLLGACFDHHDNPGGDRAVSFGTFHPIILYWFGPHGS